MRSLLLSALLLTTGALMASCCWDVGVDALYFRPIHCPLDYAEHNSFSGQTDTEDFRLIDASYDWGYRLHLDYCNDCIAFRLAYAHLSTSDQAVARTANGTTRLAFQDSIVDSARTSLKFHYEQVDLEGRYLVHNHCGLRCSLVGLIRWADIDLKSHTVGLDSPSETTRIVQYSSQFKGLGPGFGVTGDYCFPCNLRLGGRVNITALVGDRKSGEFKDVNFQGTTSFLILPDSRTTVIPNIALAVDLTYSRQVCCYLWTLEAGYEFNYYFEALRGPSPILRAPPPTYGCDDVGMAGPYLGLSVSF